MEWIIGAVVVFVVIVMIVLLRKSKPDDHVADAKFNAYRDEQKRQREADALKNQQAWLPVIDRLPLIDPEASSLLHTPIYDGASDEFELPCQHQTYEWHSNAVQAGMRIGFMSTGQVRETFINLSDWRDGPVTVIDGGDHAYLIYAGDFKESGAKVLRFVRTAADEFFAYGWRAGKEDPPFYVRDFIGAPDRWIARMKAAEQAWRLNTNYPSALGRCGHVQH
jgi:hypothetical protein